MRQLFKKIRDRILLIKYGEMPYTFLGRRMSQTSKAIAFWEKVLTPLDFKRIIELGTGNGHFSYYFRLFCKVRNADFYTFDLEDWDKPDEIREFFHQRDVFETKNIEEIATLIRSPGMTVIFCDTGTKNKIKELNVFSPYLKKGDIIAIYEWGRGVFLKDVKDICKKYNLIPIFEGARTKVWKKSKGPLNLFKQPPGVYEYKKKKL